MLALLVTLGACGRGQLLETDAAADGVSPAAEVSYALGVQIGSGLTRQPIEIDTDALVLGLRDAIAGTSRMTEADVVRVLQGYAYLREEALVNNREGREYRERNAQRDAVTTLPSGVQYEVLRDGAGPVPRPGTIVLAWYAIENIRGRAVASLLPPNGEPARLRVDDLVPGLREAVLMMPVGARWRVVIPPELAFGPVGAGSVLGPNETVIIELELVDVT